MAIKKQLLKNGTPVLLDQNQESQSFTLMIMFRTGSRNETPEIWGISHFLEHMAFKGTPTYPSPELLARELDSLGAVYNAFTSKEHTAYYIKGSKKVFERALAIISEMTICPIIRDEEVDKERGAIIEELNMYEDDPRRKVGEYFEQSLFSDQRLSQDVIGTKASLAGIHAQEILTYRKRYYTAGNMVISLAGYVPENITDMLEQSFAIMAGDHQPHLEGIIEKKKTINLLHKETQQTHLALGFVGIPYGDQDKVTASVLSVILGGNMSSRMFSEVREKRGLAYYVRTYSDNMFDTGSFVTFAGVNNEKTLEAVKVIKEVYESVQGGITEVELRRAKDYMVGMMTLGYEDSETRSESMAIAEMYGATALDLSAKIDLVEGVTVAQVHDFVERIIDFDRACLAIIGPFQDEAEFAKILGVKQK